MHTYTHFLSVGFVERAWNPNNVVWTWTHFLSVWLIERAWKALKPEIGTLISSFGRGRECGRRCGCGRGRGPRLAKTSRAAGMYRLCTLSWCEKAGF